MNQPILVAENLSKSYGVVAGLLDLTLEIEPGITGLLGPNGAGKSTLIKLVTGQLKPTSGSLKVLGHTPWNSRELYSKLGYCSDQDSYYSWMTGLEFVSQMAMLSGASKADAVKRAKEALKLAELFEGMDRPIRTYSKGMRQKAKIAQALVHNPEFLILDEPLNGLDPLGRKHILDLIQTLHSHGISVLCSSHVLHEIEAMTRNIVLLHQGRLLAVGDIRELRALIDQHPHHVNIQCDQPRALAKQALEVEGVQSVRLDEKLGSVQVESTAPDRLYSRLTELAGQQQVKIHALHSPDDNLEAVFRYLVKN